MICWRTSSDSDKFEDTLGLFGSNLDTLPSGSPDSEELTTCFYSRSGCLVTRRQLRAGRGWSCSKAKTPNPLTHHGVQSNCDPIPQNIKRSNQPKTQILKRTKNSNKLTTNILERIREIHSVSLERSTLARREYGCTHSEELTKRKILFNSFCQFYTPKPFVNSSSQRQ